MNDELAAVRFKMDEAECTARAINLFEQITFVVVQIDAVNRQRLRISRGVPGAGVDPAALAVGERPRPRAASSANRLSKLATWSRGPHVVLSCKRDADHLVRFISRLHRMGNPDPAIRILHPMML